MIRKAPEQIPNDRFQVEHAGPRLGGRIGPARLPAFQAVLPLLKPLCRSGASPHQIGVIGYWLFVRSALAAKRVRDIRAGRGIEFVD